MDHTIAAGRKIIAAQDFVAAHGVSSVFGIGGAYSTGQMVVIVLFLFLLATKGSPCSFNLNIKLAPIRPLPPAIKISFSITGLFFSERY